MALQAQYPSNFVLRREQERKEMESAPQVATGFLGQSAVLVTDGANGNAQKRSREAAGIPLAPPPQQQNHPVSLISLQAQPCSPALVNLAPQHQIHQPSLLTTCLGLASEDKQHHRSPKQFNLFSSSPASSSSCSSLFSSELAAQINHQNNEIEQFLLAKGEQLRRALAERRQRHYRALLSAAEKSAARRLREKEAEVEREARRRAELEDRLGRLRTESMAWQAKAMADQATAAALHAQLQQAVAARPPPAAGGECGDPPTAEDAESAYVDPNRVEHEVACRTCRWRRASVVLLPCRHLCLCDACEAAAELCPVCACARAGSVGVFLS
ncbi:BOI-related E3 ubiquitin-protein ligase 1-like [Musa acuminata AAA Group]|uniref:BOI-related E3 ubiquitin-protein ligase 1-like n=1 Tax=Musa acuminata AAA Group TaxID=214697 RepID=UPI0031D6A96A